jgi:hypothetical protein
LHFLLGIRAAMIWRLIRWICCRSDLSINHYVAERYKNVFIAQQEAALWSVTKRCYCCHGLLAVTAHYCSECGISQSPQAEERERRTEPLVSEPMTPVPLPTTSEMFAIYISNGKRPMHAHLCAQRWSEARRWSVYGAPTSGALSNDVY